MTPDIETARRPGASAPGARPRAPFGGKRRLYNVVPVRFERSFISELYSAGELLLRTGDRVVVDTSKGATLAEVCGIVERRVMDRQQVRRIIRRASDEDVERHERGRVKAREAFRFCVQRIRSRRLDMKLCQVEVMLDGSRVLFYFSAERRVDFRQLVRDLARQLDARIEMRQIGVRDGAGIIGGIGPCGKELCCSSFLTSFRSISIRHAKDQGLTLNPKKVSGMCGRLMCCLVYEHPTYRQAKRGAPRINRAVSTALGDGVVTEVHLLQRKVRVLLEGGATETLPFSEVVVDNNTIRRARDIKMAAPSRPKRQATITRAGSNLREEYVWDGAEAERPDITTDSSPARPSRPSSTTGDSRRDGRAKSRRRRRRRPRSRGADDAAKAQVKPPKRNADGSVAKPTPAPKRSKPEDQAGGAESADKPKRRRRRRRRRGPSSGRGGGTGGGGTGGGGTGGGTGGGGTGGGTS